MTDEALEAISQALPCLEVLGLPHCVEATDRGLSTLSKCTALTELNLACTNVGRCVRDRRWNRVTRVLSARSVLHLWVVYCGVGLLSSTTVGPWLDVALGMESPWQYWVVGGRAGAER